MGGYNLFEGMLLLAAIPEESVLRAKAASAIPVAVKAYHAMDFSSALNAVLSVSGLANQYLAEKAPWTLLKKACTLQKQSCLLKCTLT